MAAHLVTTLTSSRPYLVTNPCFARGMPPTVLLHGTDRGLLTQPLPMTPDRPEVAAYIYETDPETRPFQPRCTRHHAQERVPRRRGRLQQRRTGQGVPGALAGLRIHRHRTGSGLRARCPVVVHKSPR